MPAENEIRITPSVLDRLLDYDPLVDAESPLSRTRGLRILKDSIKRDLEWLLNTRHVSDIAREFKELNSSLATYGVPDFTNMSVKNSSDQNRLRKMIEQVVRKFEPRLRDITVTLEPTRELDRMLHFQIHAILMIEPTPEPVTFDTQLHLHSGEYRVRD
jgi:type VI secretion system protein ImpF